MGVDKDANKKDIKVAYLQKARDFHPDRRPECLEFFTHVTKAYEILHDDHKRAVYDDEQITDDDFFSVEIGGVKVNLIVVMVSTACAGVGYYLYASQSQTKKEGACPIDHKARQEMVKIGAQKQ